MDFAFLHEGSLILEDAVETVWGGGEDEIDDGVDDAGKIDGTVPAEFVGGEVHDGEEASGHHVTDTTVLRIYLVTGHQLWTVSGNRQIPSTACDVLNAVTADGIVISVSDLGSPFCGGILASKLKLLASIHFFALIVECQGVVRFESTIACSASEGDSWWEAILRPEWPQI